MQLIYNHSYNKLIKENNDLHQNYSLDLFIKHYIEIDKCSSAVLIVPTRKYVDYIKKQWIQKYYTEHKKAIGKLHIYNLLDFAALVLNEIHKNISIYSDAVLLNFVEEATQYLIDNDELKYYKRISFNLLTKMFDVINGLRKEGISADAMNDELINQNDISSANKRFHDVSKIYAHYEKLLSEKSINNTDETGIYNKIIDIIENNKINEIDNNFLNNFSFINADSMIYFYDFTEFKLPEAKFVSLFNKCKTPVLVSIDYSKENGPVIENLPRNVRRLVMNEMNTNMISNS